MNQDQSRHQNSQSPSTIPLTPKTTPSYHRLREVRLLQEVSLRGMSRRLTIASGTEVTVKDVRQQENPAADLPLSVIYRWAEVLSVPVTELLIGEDKISASIAERAKMVSAMKTVRLVQRLLNPSRKASERKVRVIRLIDQLAEQLTAVMPELAEVIYGYQERGRQRTLKECGRAYEKQIAVPYKLLQRVDQTPYTQ